MSEAPAKQKRFFTSGTCKVTSRAQRKTGPDTSSLAPEAPAETLNKARNDEVRNGIESLGDADINNKFETLNPKPGFLSAVSGVLLRIRIQMQILMSKHNHFHSETSVFEKGSVRHLDSFPYT